MEYGDKFKKAVFGGFSRQDVLHCIEELNTQHTEELEAERAEKASLQQQVTELQAQLAAAQKANEELAAQNEARSRDFAQCEEKINKAIEISNEQKAQIEAQQKELQTLKAANSELSVKRSLLEENNRALKERVEELEAEQQEKKAGIEIGEMMVEAKKAADSIISRASQRAEAAHSAVEAETAGISARLAEIRSQLSAAAEDFKTYSGSIIRSLEEMQRTIDESRERLAHPETAKSMPPAKSVPARQPASKLQTSESKNPYGFLFKK